MRSKIPSSPKVKTLHLRDARVWAQSPSHVPLYEGGIKKHIFLIAESKNTCQRIEYFNNTKMIPVTAGVRHITPSCSRPSKIKGRAQTLYRVGNSTDKEPSQKPSIQKLHKIGWWRRTEKPSVMNRIISS